MLEAEVFTLRSSFVPPFRHEIFLRRLGCVGEYFHIDEKDKQDSYL